MWSVVHKDTRNCIWKVNWPEVVTKNFPSSTTLFSVFTVAGNSTVQIIQAVIEVTNLEKFKALLKTLSLPITLNNSVEITDITTTTGVPSFSCFSCDFE